MQFEQNKFILEAYFRNSKGCFFKFGVEVGVGESIEIAPLV
jgi:hypothetical protein